VVRLAGDALDRCRRRTTDHPRPPWPRANDPLNRARRTLHTGIDLLTDQQQQRLRRCFADDVHVQVNHLNHPTYAADVNNTCARGSWLGSSAVIHR